jgi:hypothetical protein
LLLNAINVAQIIDLLSVSRSIKSAQGTLISEFSSSDTASRL